MNPSRFSPPGRPYSGYIFDCDGTLADTMPLHYEAWLSALSQQGVNFHFSWELFESRAGMSIERTVSELSRQFQVELDPELVAALQREKFRSLEHMVRPVPGVVDFARQVAKGAPVSVASGSDRESVERTLHAIGCRELFPVIVTPEDVSNGKPDPEMFLLAADRMGVPRERCVVFEDGQLGIEAARRAQMDCVVVHAARPEAQSLETSG